MGIKGYNLIADVISDRIVMKLHCGIGFHHKVFIVWVKEWRVNVE